MRRFVPGFIEDARRAGRLSGVLDAGVLFTDLSGFTMLTERAFAEGDRGAELLYAALAAVFDPLVEAVMGAGGFVAGFAGDSFTSIFPRASAAEGDRAARAAAARIRTHAAAGPTQTPLGAMSFALRTGVGAGRVSWGIVRSAPPATRRHAWYFRGEPVDVAAGTASAAETGEPPVAGTAPLSVPEEPDLDAEALRPWFPEDLIAAAEQAELRHVAAVFVEIAGLGDHAAVESAYAAVAALAEEHEGTLNKLDFGDKGSTLYLHFGAPRALERPEAAAVGFSHDLLHRVLPLLPGLGARVGIDAGRVYCGILGGTRRNEWTCTGNSVNTAARLMGQASMGQVLATDRVREAAGRWRFEGLGRRVLKGKSAPVELHALSGRASARPTAAAQGPLLGRDEERERAGQLVGGRLSPQPARRSREHVTVLVGDAGIGKSRLLAAVAVDVASRHGATVVALAGDPSTRVAWSTTVPWLESLLGTGGGLDRRSALERQFASAASGARVPQRVRDELSRTLSFVGDILGCRFEGSPFEATEEPALRHEGRVAGLVALVRALAASRPVLVTVDDAPEVDACTAAFLRALTGAVRALPVAIVMSRRPEGRLDRLLHPSCEITDVTLAPLPARELVRSLAGTLLAAELREDAEELVVERTAGNPAFAILLLEHMRATSALAPDPSGRLAITGESHLPASLESLMTARLQALDVEGREALKAASILGSEVQVADLGALLGWTEARVDDALAQCRERGLVAPSSPGRFAFRPPLLRAAASGLLLPSARAAQHARALALLGRSGPESVEARAEELANHAREAALPERERHYLAIAARGAQRRCDFRSAARQLQRLAALHAAPEERLAVLPELARVLGLLGRRADASAALHEALDLARRREDLLATGRILHLCAITELQLGRLPETESIASELLALGERISQPGLEAQALSHLGTIDRMRGTYARGEETFLRALERARASGDEAIVAMVVANRASLAMEAGDVAQAEADYRQVLEHARRSGDRRGEAIRLSNLANIYLAADRIDEAEEALVEALRIAGLIGARGIVGRCRGMLGALRFMQGQIDEAEQLLSSSVELLHEVEDAFMESNAWAFLSDVDRLRGRLVDAEQGMAESLALKRQVEDQHGTCNSLLSMADLRIEQGDLDTAEAYVVAAEEIRGTSPQRFASCLVTRGQLLARRGRLEEAAAALRDGATQARATVDLGWAGAALLELADALAQLGRHEEAGQVLDEAQATTGVARRATGAATIHGIRSRLRLSAGDAAAAEAEAREADAILARVGAVPLRITHALAPLFAALSARSAPPREELRALVERCESMAQSVGLAPASAAARAAAACRAELALME